MKKIATILVLLFVLSVSAFAEGQIPIGGIACQSGQTCSTDDGQFPIGGRNCPQGQTCLVDGEIPIGGLTEDTVFENIFDFLKSIF